MNAREATVLLVSPHPDDELLGAPAAAMALRDAGWRVVNLACSLGRPADRERRHAEVTEACRRAGFELLVPDATPLIGRDDDLALAQGELSLLIAGVVSQTGASLLLGPSPHDGHHGHEVVGRAIRDAVETRAAPFCVLFWGLWADLPFPNVLVPFGADRLTEIQGALGAHTEELARNRFDRLLRARAAANAVLGPERVFGYGASGLVGAEYAELLCELVWTPRSGWRLSAPHVFQAPAPPGGAPIPDGAAPGPDLGAWLHEPSLHARIDRG